MSSQFTHAYMVSSPSDSAERAATHPEPQVLPIFYYNDVMANPGGTIGLNLFEPRYREMCKRILNKRCPKEFLFVPNYEDYQARPGDIGFVVCVTSLQSRGQAYGIRGICGHAVLIQSSWVEPATGGLHWAKYCTIPPTCVAATVPQLRKLFEFLNTQQRSQEQINWSERGDRWSVRGNWAAGGLPKIVQFLRSEQTDRHKHPDPAGRIGRTQSMNLSASFLPNFSSSGSTPIGPFILISANMVQAAKAWVWLCGSERDVFDMRASLSACVPASALHPLPFQWPHTVSLSLCFSLLGKICADEEQQHQHSVGTGTDSGRSKGKGKGKARGAGAGAGAGMGGEGDGDSSHQDAWSWGAVLGWCREHRALRLACLFRTQACMLQTPLAVVETDQKLCNESFPWAYPDALEQAQQQQQQQQNEEQRQVQAGALQSSSSSSSNSSSSKPVRRGSSSGGDTMHVATRTVLAACVQNGSNAFFVCKVEDVQVSAPHVIPAVMRLSRKANWPRIRLLLLAQRNAGYSNDDSSMNSHDRMAMDAEQCLPALPSAVIRRVFNFLVLHEKNFPV